MPKVLTTRNVFLLILGDGTSAVVCELAAEELDDDAAAENKKHTIST